MRLRGYLLVSFLVIAIIPVAVLGTWARGRALDVELARVADQHLLLARNLQFALSRYHRDVVSAFGMLVTNALDGRAVAGPEGLMRNLSFRHLCIADAASGTIVGAIAQAPYPCPPAVPPERLNMFTALAQEDVIRMTGVHPGPNGTPVIYLVQRSGERLAVGAINTDYFVQIGGEIAFGAKGHAVIVDGAGRVLAHPLPEWVAQMRDMSGLAPVQRMLQGETGIATFYSPALKDDMVAGFTVVPEAGWGVMVPQPLAEFEATAANVRRYTLAVMGLGVLAAVLASWFLSGYLARPVRAVALAARQLAGGDRKARAALGGHLVPRELGELSESFDRMAQALNRSHDELEDIVRRRTAVLRRREQDLLLAKEAAERADRAKSDFLAMVSHEIRTPLNGVMGMAALLSNTSLDARQAQYLERVRQSGELLMTLLNEVLDVAKIEAGRLQLEAVDFELLRVVEPVLGNLQPRAEEKGLSLTLEVPADMPRFLTGDPTRIAQVLFNLVGNAVKFTESGGVAIALSHEPRADGRIDLHFAVTDTGAGIPADRQDVIFEKFAQADPSTTRRFGGTGLGLAICKQLVELMGGAIGVESAAGQGATFWFTVPCGLADAAASSAPDASWKLGTVPDPQAHEMARRRALVAEDNTINQEIIVEILHRQGISCDVVADGAAAVEAARRESYDVILLDVRMPRMNGIDAAREIRRLPPPRGRVPIVVLTGDAVSANGDLLREAGVDACVGKPFRMRELIDHIEALTGGSAAAD